MDPENVPSVCLSLEFLDVSRLQLHKESAQAICALFPNLKVLDVSYNDTIDDYLLENFCHEQGKLEELYANGVSGVLHMGVDMPVLVNLKRLELHVVTADLPLNNGAQYVLKFLKFASENLPNVEHIRYCYFTKFISFRNDFFYTLLMAELI
eukprot:TRINITY_DN2379_c1_g1_i12.p2 TRINITY_DN2379_c1_g1~~TRINITY_DN2379_c1_g1_i12.p2  ORF type:complete len:152 (+),score=39.16 TRINITY_DN2379_c1_g1_i12:493-948(+)